MPTLTCDLPESLMAALRARSARTGEPLAHIVGSALAGALEVERSTLFQVSLSTAIVEGLYDGVVRIGELKRHGDFGLGTFEGLDVELLALDGHFYQMRGDGPVREAGDDAQVPFAVVTAFRPERAFSIDRVAGAAELFTRLDGERNTQSLFYAVRIEGMFSQLRLRAVCKAESGTKLLDATARPAEHQLAEVRGTVAGFWSPSYARSLHVPGWHLHFVSQDRTVGGHLLDCRATGLRVEVQRIDDLRVALPETVDFLRADLRRDPTRDLDVAEHGEHHHAEGPG
jgi:acetolactate decarboxylase